QSRQAYQSSSRSEKREEPERPLHHPEERHYSPTGSEFAYPPPRVSVHWRMCPPVLRRAMAAWFPTGRVGRWIAHTVVPVHTSAETSERFHQNDGSSRSSYKESERHPWKKWEHQTIGQRQK